MTLKTSLLALALAVLASPAAAQDVTTAAAAEHARLLAARIPSADSVGAAAVAAIRPASEAVTRARVDDRRWVRTAKWTLLATAAGLGAYALANSRADHTDRRAQFGIVGGQIALLGSVGLFIYDLRPHDHTPENIPYEQTAPGGDADAGSRSRAPR